MNDLFPLSVSTPMLFFSDPTVRKIQNLSPVTSEMLGIEQHMSAFAAQTHQGGNCLDVKNFPSVDSHAEVKDFTGRL